MERAFIEHLEAKKLSVKTIEQYLKHWRLYYKEFKDLEQRSINKFVSKHQSYITRAFLKNLFEFIIEQNLMDEKELPKIPKIKGREKRLSKNLVKDQDLKKIRKYLLNHAMYKYVLMFDLSYYCGLRREEVTTIRKDNFYWDDWKEGFGLRLKVYAKGKERIVVIPQNTAKKIIKYFIKNREMLGGGKTFFGVKVRRWHEIFKDAVKSTGNKDITLHDLRRKRATLWLDQGIDLDEVRRRLGHSSIATTQKYLIRDEEDRLKKWENGK